MTGLTVGAAILAVVVVGWTLWRRSRPWLARLIRRRFGGYVHQLVEVDESRPREWDMSRGPAPRVAVIGAGLAGMGAACDLAERGLRVTLIDGNHYLGGKVGAWDHVAEDGTVLEVEHGFHAFFRHYYNLNGFLDRTGVRPHMKSIDDYLIVERDGTEWRFKDVEPSPVLNLVALAKSGLFRPREILSSRALHEMDVLLAYDRETTFDELDHVSYRQFAERAELPAKLRLVFNTFARAFFADDDRLSMAELIKSFHFYYLSHDHGLIYDYPEGDYQETVLGPIAAYLKARDVEVRLGRGAEAVAPTEVGWLVDGERFDHVVLATSSVGAQAIAERSPALEKAAPDLARDLRSLRPSQGYAVWRLWIDRDVREGLPVFLSTERAEVLDAVTLYHRITPAARAWAAECGGSVIELHCYALPDSCDEATVRRAFLDELLHYFPELEGMAIPYDVLQVRRDFTAFHLGMDAARPETKTSLPGLYLAGDWVKLPCPAMLMEAAYTSSLLATNAILDDLGLRPYPVLTVPMRGLLCDLRKKKVTAQGRRSGRLGQLRPTAGVDSP